MLKYGERRPEHTMKNISHFQLLIDSLIHPKKLAAYRILTIGKIIQYTFILVLIMTAFSLGQFAQNGFKSIIGYEDIKSYAENLEWLIYCLSALFLFIMNTCILYAKVSIYALVGLLLGKSMNRRMEYRHIWRTTAFAITWEILLSILFSVLHITGAIPTIISIFITMGIILIALTKYPLLKK